MTEQTSCVWYTGISINNFISLSLTRTQTIVFFSFLHLTARRSQLGQCSEKGGEKSRKGCQESSHEGDRWRWNQPSSSQASARCQACSSGRGCSVQARCCYDKEIIQTSHAGQRHHPSLLSTYSGPCARLEPQCRRQARGFHDHGHFGRHGAGLHIGT